MCDVIACRDYKDGLKKKEKNIERGGRNLGGEDVDCVVYRGPYAASSYWQHVDSSRLRRGSRLELNLFDDLARLQS